MKSIVAKSEGGQARNSPLGKNAVSYLRLINGMYPGGEPVAGQPLKVIE